MYSFPSTSHALDPSALTRAIWPVVSVLDCPAVSSEKTYWVWGKASSYIIVIKVNDLLVPGGYRALWCPSCFHPWPPGESFF